MILQPQLALQEIVLIQMIAHQMDFRSIGNIILKLTILLNARTILVSLNVYMEKWSVLKIFVAALLMTHVPRLKMNLDLNNINIEELIKNRTHFNSFVFTPILEVMNVLKKRWCDKQLEKKVDEYLQGKLPIQFQNSFRAILFRQLFTPNYEFRHFMSIVNLLDIEPLFLEYHDDKFTSNNILKHSLGKMRFQQGIGRNGGINIKCRNVINFAENDGKKLKNIQTLWGQPFVEFHHELLELEFPGSSKHLFDASDWLHSQGGGAKNYYCKVLSFFIRNAVLFENFLLQGAELIFIKEIFLPAFIEVWKLTDKKPIIVPLLSLETQEDIFWVSHPIETLSCIDKKLQVK